MPKLGLIYVDKQIDIGGRQLPLHFVVTKWLNCCILLPLCRN